MFYTKCASIYSVKLILCCCSKRRKLFFQYSFFFHTSYIRKLMLSRFAIAHIRETNQYIKFICKMRSLKIMPKYGMLVHLVFPLFFNISLKNFFLSLSLVVHFRNYSFVFYVHHFFSAQQPIYAKTSVFRYVLCIFFSYSAAEFFLFFTHTHTY
jgi:hypothetical protein